MNRFRIYSATFIIAFSTLSIEIALSRLLSVISFYHLAFFAVSTAMLGMTAGAVTVYLKPLNFVKEKISNSMAKACFGFALSVPFSTFMICIIPLSTEFSLMKSFALFVLTVSCSIPFYFSGIIISAVLTKYELPINKLYASDLVGAAFGCLFVLAGLEFFDAQSLIILAGAFPILAGFLYGKNLLSNKKIWMIIVLLVVLVSSSLLNMFTHNGIKPLVVKGRFENNNNILLERWNSFSRIVVNNGSNNTPQTWGPSPVIPTGKLTYQYEMNIDGEAGTFLRKFSNLDDLDHLKYDVTNIAYYLRSGGSACIIGIGGGKDVQSAVLFDYKKITGIDVNPIFVDLLENRFKDVAGISGREGVTLVTAEARSYLTENNDKYNLIQMSLIDTWASTGAGAYSLSENALYTTEAWKVFFNRLTDDGIYTLSRWYNPSNLGETGRVVSLAVATLLELGITDPSRHIAMVTIDRVSTLIISKQPFSSSDINTLKNKVNELKFNLAISPNETPQNEVLSRIVNVKSKNELSDNIKDLPLNYEPPSDENPYFFNMLKIKSIPNIENLGAGVMRGNLMASITLFVLIICLSVLTIVTIVVPLLWGSHKEKSGKNKKSGFIAGACYFSLIGVGFMLIEISLIQRLSVYLGHPIYGLGVLLFTMILSTGLGSLISEKLPLTKRSVVYLYPLAAAAVIIALKFVLSVIITETITSHIGLKIFISIIIVFPIGLILGIYFPAGMRLVKTKFSGATPWFWALNGIFGVLSSALAIFISIYIGISVNFYIASVCYALLIFTVKKLFEENISAETTKDIN